MDLRTEKVNLETYVFGLRIKTSRRTGEVVEFVVIDVNSISDVKTDYDEEGRPVEVQVNPEERICVSPFRRVTLEDGSVNLIEKTQVEKENEVRDSAMRKFFAKYSGLNMQKDFPEGTTVFEGVANE